MTSTKPYIASTSDYTQVLTIITHKSNNASSRSYIDRIEHTISRLKLPILLNLKECKTQSDLEYFLQFVDGKVLIMQPSPLKLHENDQYRNAEKNQVCDVVVNNILSRLSTSKYINPYSDKILIMGRKSVGKGIHSRLAYDNDYCVSITGSQPFISQEYLNQFKVLVNCTSSDIKLPLAFSGLVFDVANNYEIKTVKKFIDDIEYDVKPANVEIVSCSKIGKMTAEMMLRDVCEIKLK